LLDGSESRSFENLQLKLPGGKKRKEKENTHTHIYTSQENNNNNKSLSFDLIYFGHLAIR